MNENEEDWFKSSLDEHSWFMEREKHSCVWKDKCKSYERLNSAARSVKDTTTQSSKPSGPKTTVRDVLEFLD